MRKIYLLFVILFGFQIVGLSQTTLPTPNTLIADVLSNNRFRLAWKFDDTGLFSTFGISKKLYFEISVDNGTSVQIVNSGDYFVSLPSQSYEYESAWYLKPSSQYSFKVRAIFKDETVIPAKIVNSNLSTVSNQITAANAPTYGITVLTHGFQLMGSLGDISDFERHARQIRNRLGGEATILVNSKTDQGIWEIMNYNGQLEGNSDKTKELIFLFDWSESSNGFGGFGETGELEMAADRLFSLLTEVKVKNPTTGVIETWYQNADALAKPNHFIAHSRGVGLMLQVFHRFGKYFPNVKINHFTSLDPHPAPKFGDVTFDNSYPAAPASVTASLPGFEVYTNPTNCGYDIGLPTITSTLLNVAQGNFSSVITDILGPLLYNNYVSPICTTADIEIKIPVNVEKVENYYRQSNSYEQLFYTNPDITGVMQAVKNIYSIYNLSQLDPNTSKQRIGTAASQLKTIEFKLIGDLKLLKHYFIYGSTNIKPADLIRISDLYENLKSIYSGIGTSQDLLKVDIISLVQNLMNIEVDRILKLAPFNGIFVRENQLHQTVENKWQVKLNDVIMSSGFSDKSSSKFDQAIGTALGGQHSGVHHLYFSTVDPVNSAVGADWFLPANGFQSAENQQNTGFYYSRLGGHLNANTFNWLKFPISEYDAQLIARQGKGLNPIFNSSFKYGEVGWYLCDYLGVKTIKNLEKFPIFLGATSPTDKYIYDQANNYSAYFHPKVTLKHQHCYIPTNQNYLKFSIEGDQSASFGIYISFKTKDNNTTQTYIAASDIISHSTGIKTYYYCNIPPEVKGKMAWLVLGFEYRSAQQINVPNIIENVYMDDVETTNDNSNSTFLNNSSSIYCSKPYFYGKTTLPSISSTWDGKTSIQASSFGFVNWLNLDKLPASWVPASWSKDNLKYFKNQEVTWGEAAEAVYLVATKLVFSSFQNLCGASKNQRELMLNDLISRGFITTKNAEDKIFIGDLYDLIFGVILDQGTIYPTYNRPNTKTTFMSTGHPNLLRAIQTAGILKVSNTEKYGYWLCDGFKNGEIWGVETVSRTVLSKTVSLAYAFKKEHIASLATNSANKDAKIATAAIVTLEIEDYSTAGSRFEVSENENETQPIVQVDGKTEFYKGGSSYVFSFPTDTLIDGTKVHFFWTIDGKSKGVTLASLDPNFQSVRLTFPQVTTEQKFSFYIYLGAENAHSAEMIKEIIIRPSTSSVTLTQSEYFIDNDPGVGAGISVNNNINRFGIDSTFFINTDILAIGNHTFNLRVKDSNGNWSALKTTAFAVTNPCLVAQTATISGTTIIFPSQKVELNLKFTGKTPFNYTLSNGVSGISQTRETIVVVNPIQTTTYSLQSGSNSCGNLTLSGQAIINVNNCKKPTALLSGSTSINIGQSTNLSISFSGTPPFNYELTNGVIGTTNNNSINITVAPTTTTNYYLKSISNSCGNGFIGGRATISVNQCTLPIASITGTQTITAGQTANLSVALTGVAPWTIVTNGTTFTANASPFNIPVSPSTTTTYTLTSLTNSCGAGTVSGSAVVTVIPVNPCPSSSIFPLGVQVSGIYQAATTISSRSSTAAPAYYSAGNSVTLLPGFAIQNGTFTAKVKGCPSVASITGLVLYLPFNGNANDISGNNNNGVVTGATLGNDRFSFPNKAYRFNDGNLITVANSASLSLANSFTFSMWVNMQSTTGRDGFGAIAPYGNHSLFTKNCDQGQLYAAIAPASNGTFQFTTYASSIGNNPIIPFTLNQWKHLSIVYDGTTLKHFVDGTMVSSKTVSMNLTPSNSYNLIIGKMGCWSYYFNGLIDEFRMYNRALNNTEVLDIYNAEKP